ncbi:MAG TPA: hypothetical protein DD803_01290 [Alcaligenes faecalis]|nr:hypothetical protein [Alcaligenes faecalis]
MALRIIIGSPLFEMPFLTGHLKIAIRLLIAFSYLNIFMNGIILKITRISSSLSEMRVPCLAQSFFFLKAMAL